MSNLATWSLWYPSCTVMTTYGSALDWSLFATGMSLAAVTLTYIGLFFVAANCLNLFDCKCLLTAPWNTTTLRRSRR